MVQYAQYSIVVKHRRLCVDTTNHMTMKNMLVLQLIKSQNGSTLISAKLNVQIHVQNVLDIGH